MITTDITTDIGLARLLLNDVSGTIFDDAGLSAILIQANASTPLPVAPSRLTTDILYFGVYLGWLVKAGILADKAKKQKIAIISKDTNVTYEAAIGIAEKYRILSLHAGPDAIIVTELPLLDTSSPFIDTTSQFLPPPVSILGEVW